MKPKINAILKKKYEDQYVQVGNDLARNGTLTYAARGMLIHILSYPEDWVIYQEKFVTEKVGISAVRTIFKELQNQGYLHYITLSDGKGMITKYWCVSGSPESKEYWVERLSENMNLLNLENLSLRKSKAINKDIIETKKEEERKDSSSCSSNFYTRIMEEIWKAYCGHYKRSYLGLPLENKLKLESAARWFIDYFNIQFDRDYDEQQIPERVKDIFQAIQLYYQDMIEREKFVLSPGHLCSDLTWNTIMPIHGKWAKVKKGK